MKKVTKKEIAKVLRTQNVTNIFKLCANLCVDVDNKGEVMKFIKDNAPSQRVYSNAYKLSYGSNWFKNFRAKETSVKMPIKDAIDFAKKHKKRGFDSYSKVLILGNKNIYWASPVYQHSDYNKSVAFPNTPKFRKIADLINKYLNH
jgi:hypothetical protein